MPVYRVYIIHDQIRNFSQSIDCETDLQAMERVQTAVKEDFELWEGDRLVVIVDQPERGQQAR